MKVFFLFTFALCFSLSVRAQTSGAAYSPEQLDQLLGPIALYPDPLIALILPASTVPSDLALAAQYLTANGAAGAIEAQTWDQSVKGLAHYPDVVKWMIDNPDWTRTLGAAFAQQPSDVMKSIQQLRAQARAAGTLVDTPQQRVQMEGDDLRIIPAQPTTIYVPAYDPALVYEAPVRENGPFITFGIGFPVGDWLGYQCDWDDFGIWVGPWSHSWSYQRNWQHPGSVGSPWRAWRPDPNRSREIVRNFYRPESPLPRPGLVGSYRGPVRRPGEAAPRPTYRAPSLPDYRGRGTESARPNTPAPSGQIFGGYNRGTQTREFSNRGQGSRSAPVRNLSPSRESTPPRGAAPSRGPAPAGASGPAPNRGSAPGGEGRERH